MGKHTRKRLRKDRPAHERAIPLGTAIPSDDEVNKDDEERRLESLLFGKPSVARRERTTMCEEEDSESENDVEVNAAELEGLLDSDLFFVDDGAASKFQHAKDDVFDVNSPVSEEPSHASKNVNDSDDAQSEASNDADKPGAEALPTTPALPASRPPNPKLKSRKAPAWTDPDDASLEVSLASSARLRKLRDAPEEDAINGREYERRLRRQFVKMNPTPEWATAAARRKRRRTDGSADGDDDVGGLDLDTLVTSSGGILGHRRRTRLDPGVLAIERLRDANQAAQAEGEVNAIQFHPSPQVSMLLIASSDRRIRLFNIDGHTNPRLQTLHIPALPVTNAQFHPSGSSILLTGHCPFYYTYDLQSGATTRSPRGLWGTTFTNGNNNADLSMETCAFNSGGDVLAVAGRRGYVHLVDWRTGGGQAVGSVKANTGVRALWWLPNGRELMTLGEDAEAYLWDIGTRRCVHRWKDDGGFGSRVLVGDHSGNYVAIGSKSGIVNVYDSETSTSWRKSDRPKPLKAIGNLTTSISVARFNQDSQLLAIASKAQKDQLRLIHMPSLTAFSNWPTSSTPLGHVTSVDFSSGSEYVAIGNTRGRVLLYHLKDYDAHGG
ncbi:WD40 repeat-like protein [Lactarius psammicola]|nr:WD40 repeat-like protein [Lactarius psammicola]